MQDHRTYPAQLPVELRNVSFSELRSDPRLRVFQFHMGLSRDFVVPADPHTFLTVKLAYNDHGDYRQRAPTRVKLDAHRCIALPFRRAPGRLKEVKSLQFGDYIVRCAFLIEDGLVLLLSDHSRAQPTFDVLACNGTVRFPLAEVLHFPRASPIIEGGLLPRPSNGFPSAPWADLQLQIVRAHGADAKLRVAAVVFKKFTWASDDNLWLLWMLDVVGVDHVVINIATRDMDMAVARESMAQHPGLAERVTLVDLDMPSRRSNHSHSYLLQAQAHELFLRWQADFDFIFLIDPDEFPQLFDTTNTTNITANTANKTINITANNTANSTANHSSTAQQQQPRIDIKTFIGRNRARIEEQGQAYFSRPFVLRSERNMEEDPLLPTFLRELAPLNGVVTSAVWSDKSKPVEELGKALFPVRAALRPYLHYNDFWPKRTTFDWRAGHVLHVREQPKNGKANQAPGLQWFLDEFAKRKEDHVPAQT